MKRTLYIVMAVALLMTSCANEYNAVYRMNDQQYRYEYAKEAFANGKNSRAMQLLEELVSYNKGTDNAEECLYMLAMSQYNYGDYEAASMTFSKYFTTYTKGKYAEMACYFKGQSLYMDAPEPRLDQASTVLAIKAFQDYLDIYPNAVMKEQVHERLRVLQDKLVRKELYSAKLYYDLGSYFGNCGPGENNYDACIITAQNALKEYPYTQRREDFAVLIMKSKYELAGITVKERQLERYQDAEEECYGFLNEYPDSKEVAPAEKIIEDC